MPPSKPAPIFKKKVRKVRNTPIWKQKNSKLGPHAEWNQAEKIVAKLGGPYKTAELVGVDPSSVFRWMSPVASNGIIPRSSAMIIRRIARQNGILITEADWMPENTKVREEED